MRGKPETIMEVTLIILAGGKSLRLGRNKALEIVSGKSLIERVAERLKPITDQLIIVTSKEQVGLPFIHGAEVVADIYPGKGPLGGIYTGLMASRSDQNIVVACDMPFLNAELLRHMIELSPGYDAVVPRLGEGTIEPLHSVYSKSCLPVIRMRLENDQLEIIPSLEQLRVRYVEEAECRRFDPQLLTFFNMNRQSDLDRAIDIADEAGS